MLRVKWCILLWVLQHTSVRLCSSLVIEPATDPWGGLEILIRVWLGQEGSTAHNESRYHCTVKQVDTAGLPNARYPQQLDECELEKYGVRA